MRRPAPSVHLGLAGISAGLALALLTLPAVADRGRYGGGWRERGGGRTRDVATTRAALSACASHFYGDSGRACVAAVSGGRHRDSAGVVEACGSSFYASSQALACVTRSLAGGVAPALVRACASTFYASSAQLDCIDSAVGVRLDPAVVTACGDEFYASSSQLACVRAVAGTWLGPDAVSACSDGFYSSSAQLQCLTTLRGVRAEPAEVVGFCTDEYYGSAEQLACLAAF
jgi:hypothetical protein